MKQVMLKVGGMDCGGCVKAVERAASHVEGVSSAKVDLAKGEATIAFDEAKTSAEAVASVITRAGFPSAPL